MIDLRPLLDAALSADAKTWFDSVQGDASRIPVLLPQLPRRVGRGPLGGARTSANGIDVDLAAWRTCDAAAAILLAEVTDPDVALDLFAHGDFEERAMVMRSRTVLPIDGATIALLGEAQRTNTQDHVDAIALDSNLVARAVDGGFPVDDFNRLILKAAFVDMPLGRMFDAIRHSNATLSTMLQDFATEREAAGRNVWHDTNRMIGHAPAPGSVGRLLGGLEHGDDNHRSAAVEGLTALLRADTNRDDLRSYLRERAPREPRPSIREAIEAALRTES